MRKMIQRRDEAGSRVMLRLEHGEMLHEGCCDWPDFKRMALVAVEKRRLCGRYHVAGQEGVMKNETQDGAL